MSFYSDTSLTYNRLGLAISPTFSLMDNSRLSLANLKSSKKTTDFLKFFLNLGYSSTVDVFTLPIRSYSYIKSYRNYKKWNSSTYQKMSSLLLRNAFSRLCLGKSLDLLKTSKIKQLALGFILSSITIPMSEMTLKSTIKLLNTFKLEFEATQEIIKNFKFEPLRIFDVAFFIPVLEELVFRKKLHSVMRSYQKNPDSDSSKIIRVFWSSLIFTILHCRPSQGWFNLAVFNTIFLTSLFWGLSREITGGVTSSSTVHIFSNSFSLYQLHLEKSQ